MIICRPFALCSYTFINSARSLMPGYCPSRHFRSINFYPSESMSALSGTVTAVMVLIELLDEEEPEAAGEE